ncbi:hypothetical protein BDV32DRAFT_157573 [Aspergillus pseudonomiae]|uniref:Uncharacterized protein n=1 Tax=Aspergillus pseudonomiae TaxID=1506151 RepID=A0A5N6I7C8_9EURO|nr:uncharacterized protein BDV37DRAFT_252129 [Aspergillus pseudonomiae]KAB8262114.1 hypothetical protein BDV32DRAFT_157573 [Aspergillus pseudonomiae]KAE8402692.1 hypothetical protein BDV37DRAFT_252129 [Aspergillus pseudonomiae]
MARTRSQQAQLATCRNKTSQRKRSLRHHNSASLQGSNVQGNENIKRRAAKKTKPSYLERSPFEVERDPNRTLRLFALPREIFDKIINHLPRDAEACFTLTCKEALHLLSTASWASFRGRARLYGLQYGSYRSLVELLQRDVPGSEYCLRCETLHPPLKLPRDHRETKWTKHCMGQLASIDYWPQTPSGGYSLVWEHILEAFKSQPVSSDARALISLFDGDFTFTQGVVNYRLCSSAQWVDRNLILTQEHRVRKSHSQTRALQAGDITSLPFRVCAHLSTTNAPPPKNCRSKKPVSNSSRLTMAIAAAFPPRLRQGVQQLSISPDLADAETKDDFTGRCKSCTTKFAVRYEGGNGGEIIVTAWHCFGKELWKAQQFWTYLVRREGPTLGPAKRNSEYWSVSRSLPDFKIPEDI